MAGFRKNIFKLISGISELVSPALLQKILKQQLILPFYHTISNKPLPHIKHLYQVKSENEFINDLDFLLKYYEPIDYETFRDFVTGKKQLKKPSFMLSFDDGLSEFYSVIAPILIGKGIPAVCFLNSAFVDNKALFFRYKASLILDKIENNPNLVEVVSEYLNNSKDIKQKILKLGYSDEHLLNKIAESITFDFNKFLKEENPYLNSNQIKKLINQGFYFGAHSIDHPQYQFISLEEQLRQTKESLNFVTENFELNYKIFAFPFTDYGISTDFFKQVNRKKLVDFTFSSAGQKRDRISNNFQRIPFETGKYSAKRIHNTELLYYLFKIPFSKNEIKRK